MADISLSKQVFVFFAMILCGIICGVLFDFFRALRRFNKTGNTVVAFQDVVFWLLELSLVYMVAFKLDYAHIRGYEAVALVIGSLLYFMTISSRIMKLFLVLISWISKTAGFVKKPVIMLFCHVNNLVGRVFSTLFNSIKKHIPKLRKPSKKV